MVFKKQNRVQLETLVRSNSLFLEAHTHSRIQNSQKNFILNDRQILRSVGNVDLLCVLFDECRSDRTTHGF